MILQSLVELARREKLLGDPAYVFEPVHWSVDIDPEGNVLEVSYLGTRDEGKKKETFPKHPIPKRSGRSGTKLTPEWLVDKAEYLFALGDPRAPDRRDRLEPCRRASIDATLQLERATNDPLVRAQRLALERIASDPALFLARWCGQLESIECPLGAASALARVPKRWKTNHLFEFRVDGQPVCRTERVRQWLLGRLEEASVGAPADLDMCLVTGKWARTARLHSKLRIPGDTGPLPFVSFNQDAFEHYGRKGNANAPISVEAEQCIFMALRRLFSQGDFRHPTDGRPLPSRNLALSSNTTVLYWADDADPDNSSCEALMLGEVLGGAQAAVGDVPNTYHAPWRGRRAPIEDPTALHALIVTRVKSRVMIRTAVTRTVADTARSVEQYLRDFEICGCSEKRWEFRGVRSLASATLNPKETDGQPSADLVTRLFEAALDRRRRYPQELLAAVLRRIRAHDDEQVSERRAALVKGILNRNAQLVKELSVSLDQEYPSPAYQLGRLFAVLEKAQDEAINPEAGIASRFLGTAMTAPALVFPRLLKTSHHHLTKLGSERRGREVQLSKLIDEIASRLPPELPRAQALVDQGAFMVGYHHQRADLWLRKDKDQEDAND